MAPICAEGLIQEIIKLLLKNELLIIYAVIYLAIYELT